MKRHLSLLSIFALLAGCYNTDEQLINEQIPSDGRIFTASFEQNDTRTHVEEGNLLRWNEGDQITIFDSNTLNQQYRFDGETGDNGGTFSKVSNSFGTGNDLNCHYAVYPYNKDIKITETGVITANLPAEQSYAENSFGLGANTMVAVTKDVDDTFLKFRNVGGYLKLQLYGENVTVKSITLTGNNNEKIAGKATITPAYEQAQTLTMNDDATTSITLDCGDGVTLGSTKETATAFWIVVPPTTFEGGFEVTIIDINGDRFIKSTSNAVVIERNIIKPMAAFDVEIVAEGTIPNNEIWYTTKNGKITNPMSTDVFGANIVSNVYTDGKGIITFDGNVTSIGNDAFAFCGYLTSITIPNSVTTIGNYAFWDCSALRNIIIPEGVTTIKNSTFSCCSSLADITIPNTVTSIGSSAFYECSSLTNIIIPDGVTAIKNDTFSGCSSLANITIPNTVISIGSKAFYECSSLKSINLPGDLTSIGEKAFNGCKSLTSVIIPDNVNSVGNFAFQRCASMASVTIGDKVSAINEGTFHSCKSLTNIVWGTNITSIGKAAFYDCDALQSLVIPSNITIGNTAFRYCGSLANIAFGENVEIIGEFAFEDCDALSTISFEGKVTLGLGSFVNCDGLTYLEIPEQVVVGNTSFKNCKSIESLVINGDLSKAYSAFTGCESLKEVKVFNNYRIDHFAFSGCSNLSSVTLDSNLKEIGQGAFSYTHLTTVMIPENVSKIEYTAFKGIPIQKCYCYATTPPNLTAANNDGTTLSIFQDMDTNVILYVPKNSKSAYANSRWGTYFAKIMEMQ